VRGLSAFALVCVSACGGGLVESDTDPSDGTESSGAADDAVDDGVDGPTSQPETSPTDDGPGDTTVGDPSTTGSDPSTTVGEETTGTTDEGTTTGTSGGPICGGLVWDAQMDVDPTTLENNGDGVPDWAFDGPFPVETLVGGVWQAAPMSWLRTSPDDPFAGRVIVDVRLRSVAIGTRGATFAVNTGQDDDTVSFMFVNVRLFEGGTQTVTVGGRTDPMTAMQLVQAPALPADFVDVHLDADVVAGQVAVIIAGVDYGTHAMPSYVGTADPYAVVGASMFAAEIDAVTIERCD